jgi:antitoxin Phd
MMQEWRLADAKNRFTELVNQALSSGPQTIRRRNDWVVLLSKDDYERLTGKKPGFKDALLNPPHSLAEIDVARDPSAMREFE